MPRTKDFKTKEEAAEAWNTWAGRAREITQNEYNHLNNSIMRDYPIQNGKLILPDGEHAFGDLVIADTGGFESPWPRIYLADYAHSESGLYGENDMFTVYKLRARWRLINKDNPKLKRELVRLIRHNDRENNLLNRTLEKWNSLLSNSGFPPFEENDLRGADLSGLTIKPEQGRMTFLRHVNLSFAECHLMCLRNANLYEANLTGVKGVQIDLSNSLCHGVSFVASYLPQARFLLTDLGFAKFKFALLSLSNFDGANCHGADFSSSMLRKSTFGFVDPRSAPLGRTVYAELKDVKWDENTMFEEVSFNDFLSEQNKDLFDYVKAQKEGHTIGKELLSSVEAKPGIFGFSVDLRRIASAIEKAFKRWNGRT